MGRALAIAGPGTIPAGVSAAPLAVGPPGRLAVAMVSKALVTAAHRPKAEAIAAEDDIDLTVVVPRRWRDSGRLVDAAPAPGAAYDLETVAALGWGSFHFHVFPGLGRLLTRLRPAVVHVDEEPYNPAAAHGVFAARRAGARAIFFAWQNLYRRYPPPFRFLEAYVFRSAAGAVAGTEDAAAVLRRKGYGGPLWVVPQFGVDIDVFVPPSPGVAARAPGAPFTVGYAGRLVAAKGVDLVLDAVAGLGVDWRLEVAGDGPARPDLEEQARRLGVSRRVSFRGWLPRGELPAFYRGLDVLVLASRTTSRWMEQFGRVLVEAMACGVPCVGTDSGEIPTVIGAGGVVVPEANAAALGQALAELAADPDRRARLGHLGRRRVRRHYSTARVAAATAAIYRAVALPEARGDGAPLAHHGAGRPAA